MALSGVLRLDEEPWARVRRGEEVMHISWSDGRECPCLGTAQEYMALTAADCGRLSPRSARNYSAMVSRTADRLDKWIDGWLNG